MKTWIQLSIILCSKSDLVLSLALGQWHIGFFVSYFPDSYQCDWLDGCFLFLSYPKWYFYIRLHMEAYVSDTVSLDPTFSLVYFFLPLCSNGLLLSTWDFNDAIFQPLKNSEHYLGHTWLCVCSARKGHIVQQIEEKYKSGKKLTKRGMTDSIEVISQFNTWTLFDKFLYLFQNTF